MSSAVPEVHASILENCVLNVDWEGERGGHIMVGKIFTSIDKFTKITPICKQMFG